MTWDSRNIRSGMLVKSTKGERIGKVIRCNAETFVVEKGAVMPKDYELRYDHITAVNGDTIFYSLSDYLERESRLRSEAAAAAAGGGATAATAARKAAEPSVPAKLPEPPAPPTPLQARSAERLAGDEHELRIPLLADEIGVETVARETGRVRIRKTVKTEEQHFTVPVKREEIVIEHVSASAAAAESMSAAPGGRELMFEEQTFDVPLHEQEVHVTTRPHVREEVVVRTVTELVEKDASCTLRHEEAEIEDTRPNAPSLRNNEPRPGLRA